MFFLFSYSRTVLDLIDIDTHVGSLHHAIERSSDRSNDIKKKKKKKLCRHVRTSTINKYSH